MKNLLAAITIACALIVSANAQKNSFNFKTQIGVVDANAQKEMCLTIPNANLSKGEHITLVAEGVVHQATILRKLTKSCSSHSESDGASFYLLKPIKKAASTNDDPVIPPNIAIYGSRNPLKAVRHLVSADLDGDKKKEYFRECTSSEGIHLTIWSGKPLVGKRVWHQYYYLGYDVEANCKKKDYQE